MPIQRTTMQSRRSSFIEALINVVIGYWVSFVANALVLPHFGFHITLTQNLTIGFIFTIISIVRSYCIRRWFNAYIHRIANHVG